MKLTPLLFGCTLALVGCDTTDVTDPNLVASGSVGLTYTGAGQANATTYSAVGAPPVNMTNFGTTPWAVGSSAVAGEISTMGVVPRTATTWDIAFVSIARTTVGSSAINPSCSATACTNVMVEFGANAGQTTWSFLCTLSTGTVAIATISSTRATGTFSGSGTCISGTGTSTAFTVANGTFDVALVSTTL